MTLDRLRAAIDDLTVWQVVDRPFTESALDAELARVEAVVTAARAVVAEGRADTNAYSDAAIFDYALSVDVFTALQSALAALEES